MAPISSWWTPPKKAGPGSLASVGTCSAGSQNRSSAPSNSRYPAARMPSSHSRTYRSDSPARLASSPLVAGPPRASCLNRPSRSPRAAITTVAAAAVSVSTRPVNSCALLSSMIVPPSLATRGRFGELATAGVAAMRPDMVYVWALASLARGCCVLGSRQHATRLYQALLPFAGRAAVGAGAVMCAGSASRYLGGLAALSGQTAAAEEHFKVAIAHHRLLGAKPLLARSLHEYAQLLAARAAGPDLARAAEALGEARAIAAE